MDTGLRQQALTRLAENQMLRIRYGQVRHLTVAQGMAWVTQDDAHQQIEREARRMRAEAISSLVHQLAIVLRRFWANVRKFPRTFRTRTAARTPQ